jgi:ribosomal protein S6--L-glutamate ligase
MLPNTAVITRRKDLFDLIAQYNRQQIGRVITKEDHMHCGRGIRRWDDIEILYSFTALDETAYPLVVQPYQDQLTDIRVIIVDDYVEAYVRWNPDNFRANISAGGESRPYELDQEQEQFCRDVMQRAGFPFAHLDLHITANGQHRLSEIALNGGIRAARIDRDALEGKKQAVIDRLVAKLS